MTAILGISAFYHDSAAALVVDGLIVSAAQEERFSRVKHDAAFPRRAIAYCLSAAGLNIADLDYVVFYEKPFWKFERLLETHLAFAPRSYQAFRRAMPSWLSSKLTMTRELRSQLNLPRSVPIVYMDHHQSHAASAFLPSPFEEAAILTVDGVGEWSTTCIGHGRANQVELIEELRFPHSLGLLYSAVTAYLGFRVNGGEYKVMGLAPYGQPRFADCMQHQLIDLKDDGSFRLDMQYFDFGHAMRMTSARFHRLMGGPPRRAESAIETRHLDIAASLQQVTGEILLRLSRHAHARTGVRHLVMAGGVALNCVANSHLLAEGPFDQLWIQPAAGDAGGALGAAMFVWHQLLQHPRSTSRGDAMQGALLGPSFDAHQICEMLQTHGAVYRHCPQREQLLQATVELLGDQHVVGWFQGRMEFGPRALGARSILADPRSPTMAQRLNEKVKRRETFRPFAPSIPAELAPRVFDLPKAQGNPYMLLTAGLADDQRLPVSSDDQAPAGLERRHIVRSRLPAITHVDYSARVQAVDAHSQPMFHQLLTRWLQYSECPVLINTSFNVRGEPLVCSPEDAWQCFMSTDMDALVIGDYVVLKSEQLPETAAAKRHWPAD